jgi:hypothetical protein
MWSSHDLDLVVWLGVNDIWPVRMIRSDGTRHMDFEYEGPEPRDLIDQYFHRPQGARHLWPGAQDGDVCQPAWRARSSIREAAEVGR